jgi:phosphoglycolate phosphatase-like HAD superfamily hydrolase
LDRETVTRSHGVQLLVTDLDNTLYDWVGSFVPAFYAMAEEAANILGVDGETLLDELRAVHQRHGSSEHPFALLETASVETRLVGQPRDQVLKVLDPAFHRFNSVRKRTLALYEGVIETLQAVVATGVPVVAYTDARIPNSLYRVNRLGLDRLVEHLYAPAARFPSDLGEPAANEQLLRVLPESDKKPNPRTLLDICNDLSVAPNDTVYVGDSLSRDIYMAQSAGVRSAWARYGTEVDSALWEKLVRVTHWTKEDVASEARLKAESAGARPDVVLDRFDDLLAHFNFMPQRLANRA